VTAAAETPVVWSSPHPPQTPQKPSLRSSTPSPPPPSRPIPDGDWIDPDFYPFHAKCRPRYASVRDFEFRKCPADPFSTFALFVQLGCSLDVMRPCLKATGCIVSENDQKSTRIVLVPEALTHLSLFSGHEQLKSPDHTTVMAGFLDIACLLGSHFRDPRRERFPNEPEPQWAGHSKVAKLVEPWISVQNGVTVEEAVTGQPFMVEPLKTPFVRQNLLFRFESKSTIRRSFDVTINRSATAKLLYRYQLLWAIGEKHGVFMDSELDVEALKSSGRAREFHGDEIADVEFCSFELAGRKPLFAAL
jgi:hypothetical protein